MLLCTAPHCLLWQIWQHLAVAYSQQLVQDLAIDHFSGYSRAHTTLGVDKKDPGSVSSQGRFSQLKSPLRTQQLFLLLREHHEKFSLRD